MGSTPSTHHLIANPLPFSGYMTWHWYCNIIMHHILHCKYWSIHIFKYNDNSRNYFYNTFWQDIMIYEACVERLAFYKRSKKCWVMVESWIYYKHTWQHIPYFSVFFFSVSFVRFPLDSDLASWVACLSLGQRWTRARHHWCLGKAMETRAQDPATTWHDCHFLYTKFSSCRLIFHNFLR